MIFMGFQNIDSIVLGLSRHKHFSGDNQTALPFIVFNQKVLNSS